MLRVYLIIIAIGLAIGFMTPDRQEPLATPKAPERSVIEVPGAKIRAKSAAAVTGPWTTLQREANGHFYTRAQVNGQSVDFIIDTGATSVALTEADARRIGIPLDPSNYEQVGTGASGPVYGQYVTFDRVTLDGKTVERVEGAVLQGLEVSLLGQSFLGRMGKIEISSNTMIIR